MPGPAPAVPALSDAGPRGIPSSRNATGGGPSESGKSRVNAHAIRMRADRGTEDDLIRRAAGGDVRALEALYREHVGAVYALCLRMVGDERRADELSQDAWVRAWERLPSFRFESAFSTWLYRVTSNVVLESERRRRRRERGTPRGRADHGPVGLDQRVVDRIALERAIAVLPPRARAVFVLHDLEGRTHPEVSAILDIAEGTSRAHLFAARERLRRMLRP